MKSDVEQKDQKSDVEGLPIDTVRRIFFLMTTKAERIALRRQGREEREMRYRVIHKYSISQADGSREFTVFRCGDLEVARDILTGLDMCAGEMAWVRDVEADRIVLSRICRSGRG
jgi:hypothetical protein